MADPGEINKHGQKLLEKTSQRGNHRFARVYVLQCGKCGEEYGANGCDFHERICPNCGGKPGIELEGRANAHRT